MARKTIDVETTAQAYLALLRERGIDYFFANAGTDFAPLIDAFARFAEQGKQTPQPITVPHENAAVAMAHGYYMVTGRAASGHGARQRRHRERTEWHHQCRS